MERYASYSVCVRKTKTKQVKCIKEKIGITHLDKKDIKDIVWSSGLAFR